MNNGRQTLPEGELCEEAFVLSVLRQVHEGRLAYNKSNNRRELCEAFWIRKADFQRLITAIKRLREKGVLLQDEVTVRPAQRYAGYCNPACRRVTLEIAPEPVATQPSRPELANAYFAS